MECDDDGGRHSRIGIDERRTDGGHSLWKIVERESDDYQAEGAQAWASNVNACKEEDSYDSCEKTGDDDLPTFTIAKACRKDLSQTDRDHRAGDKKEKDCDESLTELAQEDDREAQESRACSSDC